MRSLRKFVGEIFLLLFWIALVLCGIECSRDAVRKRRYEGKRDVPDKGAFEPSATVMVAAERELTNADARRKILDDKARMLLALVGLLIPVTATLASRLTLPGLVLAPLVCFLSSALILVGYLAVGVAMKPKLSSDEIFLDEKELKRQLVVDLLRSARTAEQ